MPFTEHDLDHQELRVQVLLLQQLVLKLFVLLAESRAGSDPQSKADLARALVQSASESLTAFPQFPQLHEAEQNLFDDQASEILQHLKTHLEFILQGSL